MQSRGKWRLAAIIAPPLMALTLATLVACRDALTSGGPTVSDDAQMTLTPIVSDAAVRARSKLRERNAYDWVGVAHNRALDDIRTEMRKPGRRTRNLCDYALDFVTNPDRLPAGKRHLRSATQRESAIAGLAQTGLCRGRKASTHGASFSPVGAPALFVQEGDISQAAYDLMGTIENAVAAAADNYDLAVRLNQVLDAAASLDSIDQEVIGATVSTAQYSFEYWQSHLLVYQEEFWGQYSGCATQYRDAGYSSDDALSGCVVGGGSGDGTWSANPGNVQPRSPMLFRFASHSTPMGCDLGTHFKALAGADAVGALTGAVKGIFGGPGGILTGAFAGGSLASFGSFVKSTWDLYWCAMK